MAMLKKLLFVVIAGFALAYLTGHDPANFKSSLNGMSQRGSSAALPTNDDGWGDPH